MKNILLTLFFFNLVTSINAQLSSSYETFLAKSNLNFQQKKYKESLLNLAKASDLQVNDTIMSIRVAIGADSLATEEMAIRYYERAITHGATKLILFQNLALHLQKQRQVDKSLKTLSQGLSHYPNNDELIQTKTIILLSKTPIDTLIRHYEIKQQDAQETKYEILKTLSLLYSNKGDFVKSEVCIKSIQEIDPSNFSANYNLAIMYYNQGVEIKQVSDRMNVNRYQHEGIQIEKRALDKFKQSLEYYEKAYAIQQEEHIKIMLTNLYSLLKVSKKI